MRLLLLLLRNQIYAAKRKIVGTAFCLLPLEDVFGPCTNNEANCNDVIVGSFMSPDGADPFTVSLRQILEQPTSLRNKGVIDFTITPATHSQAWKSQKDKLPSNLVLYPTVTISTLSLILRLMS